MPPMLLETMLTIAVAIGWLGIARMIRNVQQTALTTASGWSLWFQATLTIATVATIARRQLPVGVLDLIWYFVSVSALCPFIAVLGARLRRAADWSLFVLTPLLLVLQWPALAQWRRCWNGQRLELELPTLLGFWLVLLMGAGNFLGTKLTRPAIVSIATWGLVVWTFGPSGGPRGFPRESIYSFVAMSQLLFWITFAKAAIRPSTATGMDKVWQDFRNSFGTVWALRLMTRVNEVAERDQWPWRLTNDGLRLTSLGNPYAGDPADDPRVDQTLRWLLKQFVEPEWIDRRLGRASLANVSNASANEAGERPTIEPQSRDHDALH